MTNRYQVEPNLDYLRNNARISDARDLLEILARVHDMPLRRVPKFLRNRAFANKYIVHFAVPNTVSITINGLIHLEKRRAYEDDGGPLPT